MQSDTINLDATRQVQVDADGFPLSAFERAADDLCLMLEIPLEEFRDVDELVAFGEHELEEAEEAGDTMTAQVLRDLLDQVREGCWLH